MNKYIFKFILLLSIALIPSMGFSQKASKQQKKAEAKKEKRIQQAKKGELNAQKKHMRIQTKKTRKRMKRNKRVATANNANKRRGLFGRLFGRRER